MQADAINRLTEGVMTRKTVQGIMPCGFGKTFVSYRVARAVVDGGPKVRYVIFATPLQRLCHQGVQDWLDYDEYDTVFGKDHIVACTSSQPTGILHVPPKEIAKWLDEHATKNGTDGTKPSAVFMCYHSLAEVREFCEKHEDEIFLICDEAHACVGPMSSGSSEGAGRYTIVHSEIRSRSSSLRYLTSRSAVTWMPIFLSSTRIFFIATTSPVSLCVAKMTSPNVPVPWKPNGREAGETQCSAAGSGRTSEQEKETRRGERNGDWNEPGFCPLHRCPRFCPWSSVVGPGKCSRWVDGEFKTCALSSSSRARSAWSITKPAEVCCDSRTFSFPSVSCYTKRPATAKATDTVKPAAGITPEADGV